MKSLKIILISLLILFSIPSFSQVYSIEDLFQEDPYHFVVKSMYTYDVDTLRYYDIKIHIMEYYDDELRIYIESETPGETAVSFFYQDGYQYFELEGRNIFKIKKSETFTFVASNIWLKDKQQHGQTEQVYDAYFDGYEIKLDLRHPFDAHEFYNSIRYKDLQVLN